MECGGEGPSRIEVENRLPERGHDVSHMHLPHVPHGGVVQSRRRTSQRNEVESCRLQLQLKSVYTQSSSKPITNPPDIAMKVEPDTSAEVPVAPSVVAMHRAPCPAPLASFGTGIQLLPGEKELWSGTFKPTRAVRSEGISSLSAGSRRMPGGAGGLQAAVRVVPRWRACIERLDAATA